ncbi:MAG TPA: antibiotic biosynthesis monooxygenase family protein [Asticcacaulis sp.]|jgi:quinol monooxygenase YgiN|nr:antibiotic biosynthesis monooxygenase family protein [Asticcacaulis sp.]
MSVLRLTTFKASPGGFPALAARFETIVAQIRALEGCQSCELLLKMADGGHHDDALIVLETWDSREAHQAAARAIDPAEFAAVMALLDAKPTGRYYTPLD